MTTPWAQPSSQPLGAVEARPRWQVSRLAWRLAAVGILAVLGGVLTRRPEPIVLAAPCLAAVLVALRMPRPDAVSVSAVVSELRSFEDDPIQVDVEVRAPAVLGEITLDLALPTLLGAGRDSVSPWWAGSSARPPVAEPPAAADAGGDAGTDPAPDGSTEAAPGTPGATSAGQNPAVVARAATGTSLFEIEGGRQRSGFDVDQLAETWTVRAGRWGRWRLGPLHLRVRTRGWGYVGHAELTLSELTVFPPPAQALDVAVPPTLLARMGAHVARRAGSGIEFAGVRAYAPGDAVRRINWAVSSRRGDDGMLYVNEYAAERAADVVAVVDTTSDVGPFGRSSLDIGVRGAAAVVQAYLRYADRVGVVALGGALRWLAPDVGTRQYYRIVETLLSSRRDDSFLEPELAHLPRQALPPGALAFVFSPLLDSRAVEAVRDLRERGHPVVVVDVLTVEPAPERHLRVSAQEERDRALALRIWRLERRVLVHELEAIGVTVLAWDEEFGVPLDRVRLEPLLRGGR